MEAWRPGCRWRPQLARRAVCAVAVPFAAIKQKTAKVLPGSAAQPFAAKGTVAVGPAADIAAETVAAVAAAVARG